MPERNLFDCAPSTLNILSYFSLACSAVLQKFFPIYKPRADRKY